MRHVSRRAFTGGLLASAFVPASSAVGQPNDPGSIAIVDTPYNAAKVTSKLSAQNVKVVVRFFARKPQPGLREKIMASDANIINGVREPTLLIRNGLSILSLYQYRNNVPAKFLSGLEDTGSAKAEVAADAKAALEQAMLVGQPEGSAIYFGIDFNLTPNRDIVDAVVEYFQVINKTVGRRYAIGVYGNGFVNRVLREEKLVSYNWLSASRSHEESVDFYNGGRWHLFQNQVDLRWFGAAGKCSIGLDVDTNLPVSVRGEREISIKTGTRKFLANAGSRSARRRSIGKAADMVDWSTASTAVPAIASREMAMSESSHSPVTGPA
jgi:hypothetical protein